METITIMVTTTDLVEDMEDIQEVVTTEDITIMIEATTRVTGTITGMEVITKATEITIEMVATTTEDHVNFGWTKVTVKKRTDACFPTPADKSE